MPIFTYQSGVWNSIKGLFFNSASTTYSNAKSGWVYDGASWKISYPSFPVNTVLPVLTGVVAFNNTITVNTGTWNTEAVVAVNPSTNFSYQWLRDGVNITSATTNSYFCVAADVGKQLSCRVTASNGRGGTPVVTASQLVVPRITVAPKYTDTTPTPAQAGSLSGSQETNPYDWRINFTKGLNTDAFELVQSGAGGSITYTSPNLAATGNSNGTSPVTVTITSVNNTCKATIDTFTAIGATGYRIKLDSGAEIPLASTITSYEFTGVSLGAHTVTVVPYFNTTPGVGNSVSFTSVKKTNTASTSITTKTLSGMGTITFTDNQPTPSGLTKPTVTPSTTTVRAWSASWTNGSNFNSVAAAASNGTTTYTSPNSTASGTATSSPITFTVTTTNSTYSATASWTAITGAAKYAYRINSGTEYETTSNSITFTQFTTPALAAGSVNVSVYPISNTYNGGTFRAAGNTSNTLSIANKTQSQTSDSTALPDPTVTATGTSAYNNFSVTMTLGADTKSVVFEYGSNIFYGSTVGTYTTNGTRSPIGPLTAGTRFWKVTPYSGLNATGLAGTPATGQTDVWAFPSVGAVSWTAAGNFLRTASNLNWYTDYPTVSGDYNTITGMEFEIRTTAGGGTLLASGTRPWPGFFTYPYVVQGVGWAFRMGTVNGDIVYDAAARYGRVRVVYTDKLGTTRYGAWTGWI